MKERERKRERDREEERERQRGRREKERRGREREREREEGEREKDVKTPKGLTVRAVRGGAGSPWQSCTQLSVRTGGPDATFGFFCIQPPFCLRLQGLKLYQREFSRVQTN